MNRSLTEFHFALLLIVGKEHDVDLARRLEHARRLPDDRAIVAYGGEHLALLLETRVRVVVEYDVGRPDEIDRQADVDHAAKVGRLPRQAVVLPLVVGLDVGDEHLILLVQVDELYEVDAEVDDHALGAVVHRPTELHLIVLEQVVDQALLVVEPIHAGRQLLRVIHVVAVHLHAIGERIRHHLAHLMHQQHEQQQRQQQRPHCAWLP